MVWAGSPLFEGQCSTVELFRFARRAKPLPDRRQIGECSSDIVAPASARPLEDAQGISEEALSFFPATKRMETASDRCPISSNSRVLMTKFTYKNLYRAASERLTIGEPTAGVLESAEIVVQVASWLR
jgi:hypothetical protein